ncbi:lysophosphatidic acid phosphatase type 6 [Nematocida sp. LUAm3]|nr:lysophosphatidic acid phosphatase type 6 [Nematocida sp. LUAm3]KAI5175334.1 lysophosphatidic acid phosphatase type 6 [Nematocida sp. LUAm2]KAI5177709.1 lysophosphatidic acid phosphatase type 6 [Nematocida sp. LUAm1]
MSLQLEYLHLIHRHGERTPLLFGPHDTTKWNLCHRTSKIRYMAPTKGFSFFDRFKILSSSDPKDNSAPPIEFNLSLVSGHRFNCAPGQLTDKGRETLSSLGAWMRRKYIEKEGFISSVFKKEEFNLRSTNFQRTLESLQSLMQGIYPVHPTSMDVRVNDLTADTLGCNRHCPKLKSMKNTANELLKREFSSKAKNISEYFKKAYTPYFSTLSPYALYDLVISSRAHDFSRFRSVPKSILDDLEQYSVRLWFDHLNTKEGLSLNTGCVLKEISDTMLSKVSGASEKLKVSVFSAHDVTVYPLLMAMGASTSQWPRFGANIIFELLKESHTDERYVLMRYNGKETPIPKCKREKIGTKEVCPLNEFLRISNEIYMKNFNEVCEQE